LQAWGGISGLQLSLPVIWSEMMERGFKVGDLIRLMCENTAKFAGLSARKGTIKEGGDADFFTWDQDAQWRLSADDIFHRHKVSPYIGRNFRGKVQQTFVRGNLVFDKGSFSDKPLGEYLSGLPDAGLCNKSSR